MTAFIEGLSLTCLPLVATTFLDRPDLVPVITVLRTAPLVLISIPAGMFADAGHRRRALRGSILVGAFGSVLLACVAVSPTAAGGTLLAVGAVLLGAAQATHSVVATTIPALLLEEADRPTGNARAMTLASTLGFIVGPAVGGLLGTVGPGPIGAALFGSYIIALIWITRMRLPESASSSALTLGARLRGIGAAAKTLVSSRDLLASTSVSMSSTLAYGITVAVLPLLITQTFRLTGNAFGVLIAAGSFASIAGAFVAPRLARRRDGLPALRISGTAAFCGYFTMATSSSPVGLFVGYVIASGSLAIWSVAATSLRQRLIPSRLMGRSMSVYMLFVMAATPIGAALSALLVPTVSPHGILLVATFVFAIGIVVMFVLQRRSTRPFTEAGGKLNG
jgi:MFS family permease